MKIATILEVASEVRELKDKIISVSSAGPTVLLREKVFKETFGTYTEDVSESGEWKMLEAVFCGVTFHAIVDIPQKLTEEEKKLCEELNKEEAQERERAFWDVGVDPGYNGTEEYDG